VMRGTLALDPNNLSVSRRLFTAYTQLGDTEQAIQWIDRYLETQRDPILRAQRKCDKFILTGDDDARERTALEGLKQYPENGNLLYHLTDLYIASDEPEKVRSRWEQAYPSLFERSLEVEWSNRWEAKDVARVLMATGEQEQADHLIGEALAVAKPVNYGDSLFLQPILNAVGRDDRQALDAIRRFLDAGGSPYRLMWQNELKPF